MDILWLFCITATGAGIPAGGQYKIAYTLDCQDFKIFNSVIPGSMSETDIDYRKSVGDLISVQMSRAKCIFTNQVDTLDTLQTIIQTKTYKPHIKRVIPMEIIDGSDSEEDTIHHKAVVHYVTGRIYDDKYQDTDCDYTYRDYEQKQWSDGTQMAIIVAGWYLHLSKKEKNRLPQAFLNNMLGKAR